MRSLASLLLLLMFATFLAARFHRDAHPIIPAIAAFAEAAMIGALADWFAVVALFRHPLGIPIPHTAVIPSNRARIARNVAAFIAENFLNPEVIREKLASLDPAQVTASWLQSPMSAQRVAQGICKVGMHTVHTLEEPNVDRLLHEMLERRLREADLSSTLARTLEAIVNAGAHEILFDETLRLCARVLDDNRDVVHRTIASQLAVSRIPIVGELVGTVLADTLIKRIGRTLTEILENPDHEVRERFQTVAQNLAADLRHDPALREHVCRLVHGSLDAALRQKGLPPIWRHIKTSILDDLESAGSDIRQQIQAAVVQFGVRLGADPALSGKINEKVRAFVTEELLPRRAIAAEFIEQTVLKWPVEEMSAKLEGHVGRDLQFIRMNGTIVGGLVGLLIYLLLGS